MTQLPLFNVPATGEKQSKRKSPALDKIKVDHELAKDRYYLNRRLDLSMFELDGAKRIIRTNFKDFSEIPKKQQKYILKAIALNYNVQYQITHDLADPVYYLQRRLDSRKFEVDKDSKIIKAGYREFSDIPKKQQRPLLQLMEIQFTIQYQIT